MYLKKRSLLVIVMLICFGWPFNEAFSQTNPEPDKAFKLNNVSLSLGWYNPSLDYWKDKSLFRDASFNGAVQATAGVDFRLTNELSLYAGFGYWQESTDDDLQGFGKTRFLLTGIPVELGLTYIIDPLRFSIVTPYVGLGGEYLFIQNKLDFEEKDNPDPQSGSTVLATGSVGFEAKLSEQFATDIEFQYKYGEYNQEFKIIEDPNYPDIYTIETESIGLMGPVIKIRFKYLF